VWHYLSLDDLFLAGLALEIAGAVLLAKGLLISPYEIYLISSKSKSKDELDGYAAFDRVVNRAAAEYGLGYIALGFLLQTAGYGLELAGVAVKTGTNRLMSAFALMALVGFASALAWKLTKYRRMVTLKERLDEVELDHLFPGWRTSGTKPERVYRLVSSPTGVQDQAPEAPGTGQTESASDKA
jgi:hypothetical protein